MLSVKVEECNAANVSAVSVDEALIRLAKQRGAAVLTNDSKLRRKLLKEGVPVVYLREKSKLEERG
ncbi:MAG: rRNA-processing protein FCF1 [Candidatus Alkanophagales archaeon MCA70_species_2]|nr:rRNA-processing protein FCF1 [Candidatus Alkanophaga liquidiphilum]